MLPHYIPFSAVIPVVLVWTQSEISSEQCPEIARGWSSNLIRESVIYSLTQRAYYAFFDDHTGILFTQSCFILAEIPLESCKSHLRSGSSNCRWENRATYPCSAFYSLPLSPSILDLLWGISGGSICVLTFHLPFPSLAPIPLPSFHPFFSLPVECPKSAGCLGKTKITGICFLSPGGLLSIAESVSSREKSRKPKRQNVTFSEGGESGGFLGRHLKDGYELERMG